MIEITVKLTANPGTFQPASFSEWIGRNIDVTGLDPALQHVLVGVDNTEDGTTSTLRVQTHSEVDADLTANMSVRWDTPTAEVRGYVDDQLIVTARLDAPVQEGATVRVGEKIYTVTAVSYPGRHEDGTVEDYDYQRADLREIEQPDTVRDAGPAAAILGMIG